MSSDFFVTYVPDRSLLLLTLFENASRFVIVEVGYVCRTMALVSLRLLMTPASHGAGDAGTAATGERQATEAKSNQALAARIKDALGKEPVLRDATNLLVVA